MPEPKANAFFTTLSAGGKTVRVKVEIAESKRAKRFCARVVGKDEICLTKPARSSRRAALEFLESVAEWAVARLAEAPEKISLRRYLSENPRVYAGGFEWRVWLEKSRTDAFFVEDAKNREVVFSSPEPDANGDRLAEAFAEFAAKKICASAAAAAEKFGVEYSRISVRNQSGRWASRSSSGALSFNERMLLLPYELQNYIICHELAHARFMDHSVSFWIWLGRLCPHAKRLDRELSKLSGKLFAVSLK